MAMKDAATVGADPEAVARALLSKYDDEPAETDPAPPPEPEAPASDPAPDAPPVAAADPASSATAAPSDDPDAPKADAPPAPPPLTAPATPPTPTPFAFTADQRTFDVPGAVLAGETIQIPKAAWDRHIQPNLRDGRAIRERESQHRREVAALREQLETKTTRGDALWEKLKALGDAGPDALAEWLDNYRQNWPVLLAEARAKDAESRLTAVDRREQAQAEEQMVGQLHESLRGAAKEWAQYYAGQPDFQGVSAEDVETLIWDLRHQLFFEADEDVPQWHLRAGDIGLNHDLVRERLGKVVAQQRAVEARLRAAEEATRKNAAALQPVTAAPPAVRSDGGGTGGTAAPAKPQTREEYLAHMEKLAGLGQ